MTPKIQKKMNALQAKMQKKHPDYEINYVYDKKGKVYALSYNENTQQFVSLKNMKPVSQDKEFFDVNDQPFTFSTGPDLYEVFNKDGNQVVLAFDKDSSQFYNPETGEPVDIENYNDEEGNPIDPAQFITDDQQPNDSEVNSQEAEEQNPNDEQSASEPNNDFVEEKYEESVPTTEFQGLEYASPTVDVNPNNLNPENAQNPNLNQPENQPNNSFYPNDNYQVQANNYPNQQLPNSSYNQPDNLNPENAQTPNLNQPENQVNNGFYPNDNYQVQDNNYPNQQFSNQDYNQPNNFVPENVQSPNLSQPEIQPNNAFYPNDNYQDQGNNYPTQKFSNPDYNQTNNYQDSYNNSIQPSYQQPLTTTEQNNYQLDNKPLNLENSNFSPQNNEIPNPVEHSNQDTLNLKTIDSSSIPTTEVASSFNNFAPIPEPKISISKPIINNGYVQPDSKNDNINVAVSTNDNYVRPILETVVDSIVDVKLDPIVQDSNKPKDQFIIIEETKKPADVNKQFVVSEENVSGDLFAKKTAELFIDETFNRSIFSKPNKNQDVVIPKPVIDSEQSLSDSKVFISPEVRPQPQAVYSSATTKKDFEPNNSYSSKINLQDFNAQNETPEPVPNLKPDVNPEYVYTEVKPVQKTYIPDDYQSADFHDFEISKPKKVSVPKYDQSFSEYPEYEPPVQDFEYNPDEQHDLYEEKPYSSLRSYRDYAKPRYYSNNNYLENSDYSYYKRDNELSTYNNYQSLNSFKSSSTRPYKSLRSLDSSLLPSSRPSSYYPTSRSLTVLIDNSPFAESRFKNYRSPYGSRSNYYRSSTYGFSPMRSLSEYGPYKVRSFKNWQPSSLTSSINTYSMPLPSSYCGYSNRLRNYRNW